MKGDRQKEVGESSEKGLYDLNQSSAKWYLQKTPVGDEKMAQI